MTNEHFQKLMSDAYKSNENEAFYKETLQKFSDLRGKIAFDHPWNKNDIPTAVKLLNSRLDHFKPWYAKPLGSVLVGVVVGLIVAYLAFIFGWQGQA